MLNSQLHDDLVIEILLRLPVKSLIRFKCVSKSWRSLISSPRFTTLHHKRASIKPMKRILVSISPDDVGSLDCDRSIFTCRYPPLHRSLKSSCPVFPDRFYVVGSCNGLICVSSGIREHNLWVWNPTTSESIEIVPDLKHKIPKFFITRVGFGYDERGDDYKIVVASSRNENWRAVDPIINIFSSKTGIWRCLADTERLNLHTEGHLSGLLVNGALHWQVGIDEIGRRETKIIAFDLAEESFRVFRPPPGVPHAYGRQIGILNELLCFCVNGYHFPQYTREQSIWAMKEYGVETSWTKLFTIADPNHNLYECLPLCSTECGDIICTSSDLSLVLFNPERDTVLHRIPEEEDTFLLPSGSYGRATVYVETLISPDVLRAKEKKYDLV